MHKIWLRSLQVGLDGVDEAEGYWLELGNATKPNFVTFCDFNDHIDVFLPILGESCLAPLVFSIYPFVSVLSTSTLSSKIVRV